MDRNKGVFGDCCLLCALVSDLKVESVIVGGKKYCRYFNKFTPPVNALSEAPPIQLMDMHFQSQTLIIITRMQKINTRRDVCKNLQADMRH